MALQNACNVTVHSQIQSELQCILNRKRDEVTQPLLSTQCNPIYSASSRRSGDSPARIAHLKDMPEDHLESKQTSDDEEASMVFSMSGSEEALEELDRGSTEERILNDELTANKRI